MAMHNMIPEGRGDVADAIRKYLAANPSADDVEVVAFLNREGIHASPALIQQVRWEMGKDAGEGGAE